MDCREKCGACCIAPSISSFIPGMPNGKLAGIPCIHLDKQFRCLLFGKKERPEVCKNLKPEPSMCATSRDQALFILNDLEKNTQP